MRWRGFLPEWDRIRTLPHASPIHRFTVDRHVIETCIEASALIRHVARPDVLLVAALLHDIGKGGLTEHSVAGEPIARAIATRMGFDAAAVDLIAAPGPSPPAPLGDGHLPRPRRPGHGRGAAREGVRGRGARPAAGPDRGRLPGRVRRRRGRRGERAWSTADRHALASAGGEAPPYDASTSGDLPVPDVVRRGGVSVVVEPDEAGRA